MRVAPRRTAPSAGRTAEISEAGSTARIAADKAKRDEVAHDPESKRVRLDAPREGKRSAPETVEALEEAERVLVAALAISGPEDEEIDGEGRPTLHHIPIAGYPEWAVVQGVYDEKSHEKLEPEVWKARDREMVKMDQHEVKRDIRIEKCKELGFKVIRSRWVDTRKALPDDPQAIRSRLVAELNMGPRDDIFGTTSQWHLSTQRRLVASR